ncbi:AlpA family phage regulatory protein [Rhodospirillaceae bacterium SYSU D60014]|uniref:helix-turn-helix transcriptional regulator n=1 Tax=Virgifigura deserti TaxID=2268457 RepID=UPI000E66AA94
MADVSRTEYDTSLPDRLVPSRKVRQLTGDICEATLWRRLQRGQFPHPVKINGRNYWRASQIADWLEKQTSLQAA